MMYEKCTFSIYIDVHQIFGGLSFCLSRKVMSVGRSADGREVQIPLQQAAPSLAAPLSVAPPITPLSHRPSNPWPPSDPPVSQGKSVSDINTSGPALLSHVVCEEV